MQIGLSNVRCSVEIIAGHDNVISDMTFGYISCIIYSNCYFGCSDMISDMSDMISEVSYILNGRHLTLNCWSAHFNTECSYINQTSNIILEVSDIKSDMPEIISDMSEILDIQYRTEKATYITGILSPFAPHTRALAAIHCSIMHTHDSDDTRPRSNRKTVLVDILQNYSHHEKGFSQGYCTG